MSGGPDSVCLLHLLDNLKEELALSLHVAHLDHGLRGAESDMDAEYVRRLAEGLDIPATVGYADVQALQKARKLTLEEAAREARYDFLAGVAHGIGTDLIATGHTLNDNVETILMHIIRGSGLRGLVGLRPLTEVTFGGKEARIIRPLLNITRDETFAYCLELRLNPRTDSSNADTTILRNKVRLKLLPLLESYNSDFGDSLLRLSAAAADELDYMDAQVEKLRDGTVTIENGLVTLDKRVLSAVHPALKRYLLRDCLEKLPGGLKDIESVHIEDMLDILDGPAGRRIDLPHCLVLVAGYDRCWLGVADIIPCPYPPMDGERRLKIPGKTKIEDWTVNASIVECFDAGEDNSLVAFMDMDKIGQSLSVRTWRQGDRFRPLGMDSEKKVGEFMKDARIPVMWRKNIPVVVSYAGIVWLVGYRLDERFKVTPQTRRILRLEFVPG